MSPTLLAKPLKPARLRLIVRHRALSTSGTWVILGPIGTCIILGSTGTWVLLDPISICVILGSGGTWVILGSVGTWIVLGSNGKWLQKSTRKSSEIDLESDFERDSLSRPISDRFPIDFKAVESKFLIQIESLYLQSECVIKQAEFFKNYLKTHDF